MKRMRYCFVFLTAILIFSVILPRQTVQISNAFSFQDEGISRKPEGIHY